MNKSYIKMLFRGVRKSITRFVSIMAIVAIGVGFLGGLIATTPDMEYTVGKYYEDYRISDFIVKGSMGLKQEDSEALKKISGVTDAMPAKVTDLIVMTDSGISYVARLYGVDTNMHTKGLINDFELESGRLPSNANECLVASPNGYTSRHDIGEVFKISEENKDYENIDQTYAFSELTVVGTIKTPYYMSVESEPSAVGTGKVGLVLYVPLESYSLDVYTDIFIKTDTKYNTFSTEYKELIDSINDKIVNLGTERSSLRYDEIVNEANESLQEAKSDYEKAKIEVQEKFDDAEKELKQAKDELANAKQSVLDKEEELIEAEKDIAKAEETLVNQIANEIEKLEQAKPLIGVQQYDIALEQINLKEEQAQSQIKNNKAEIEQGKQMLFENKELLAENEATLIEKQEEFNTAKKDAYSELEDAEIEINDAQKEISEIEIPKWYVMDRTSIVSYASYKSNVEKIDAIAKVFPIFFFLVAALVALTTMTRMVEEERMQIGTLKALGYSNGKIMFYYLGYCILATCIGSIVGITLGFRVLPVVISSAYSMMYTLPTTVTLFWWNYAIIICIIAVLCTTIATLVAVLGELTEKPSLLMLPKAPKAGKRIFMERIDFIWSKMKFTHKVTARNILRYKKRFYMTVIGIAGCTGLLVTGFGLRDSIGDIVYKQFGEIYKYNLSLQLKESNVLEKDEKLKSFLDNKEYVKSYALLSSTNGKVIANDEAGSVTVFVPFRTEELKQQITLRQRQSGVDIPFDESSVVLTEKLCETLKLKIGDSFVLENTNGDKTDLTVTAITENYVTSFIFISSTQYETCFKEKPEYKFIMAQLADNSTKTQETVSEQILKSDNVLITQFSSSIEDSFENSVKNIDYIVMVLITAAGALAIVVLYNLTNINISERKKELATIKVLGFFEREVASYIYRETTILSIIGIIVGLFFGVWLHSFVVKTAEIDAVMFGREIYLSSYLLAAGATFIFTAIVDLIMLKKLHSIDMVESMKANE